MPLDVLGYTRATMTSSTSFYFLARKGVGNLFNARRDGARFLQLLIFNEESLVCASHQLAQNASLSFVLTARRSYRLDDPARCLEDVSLFSDDLMSKALQTLSSRGS